MTEQQERKEFILSRLRSGFTRLDVQKQFGRKYDYSIETSRVWLNSTCDELVDTDINHRRRTFSIIVEMYHAQITAYQNEILAMQREVEKLSDLEDQRKLLTNQMEVATDSQLDKITARLAMLPQPRLSEKANLIEAKTRVRERMFRVICELTRLQGISDEMNNWKNALSILLDNNLVPGTMADKILTAIESHEFKMQNQINEIETIIEDE